MIEKKTVSQIVEEWLEGKDYFLVEVTVSPDDKIVVEIDHAEGVWIEDCVELSRFIESKLNREEEDYELEVGSAGIGQPFKVLQQYYNHVGSDVEVLTKDGRKLTGVLKDAPHRLQRALRRVPRAHPCGRADGEHHQRQQPSVRVHRPGSPRGLHHGHRHHHEGACHPGGGQWRR